jgi:hypothetical protein
MTDSTTITTTTIKPDKEHSPSHSSDLDVVSPIDHANPCSICSFFFVSKLITTGHARPLERADIPPMPIADNSATVDEQFTTSMSSALDRNPNVANYGTFVSAWTGVRIALEARGFQFMAGGLCLMLWAVCYGIQPVFIKAILVEIQLKHLRLTMTDSHLSNSTAAATATATFQDQVAQLQSLNPLTGLSPIQLWIVCLCTGLLQIVLLNHAFFHMFRYALSIRLGFMNKVWEKALREFLFLIVDDYYFYLYATTLTIDFYICHFWLFKNNNNYYIWKVSLPQESRTRRWETSRHSWRSIPCESWVVPLVSTGHGLVQF